MGLQSGWLVWVGVLVTLLIAAEEVALAFPFVAYGDMPYGAKAADGRTDTVVLTESIAPEIRRRTDVPFVIHVGDTGRPNDACSDAWLKQLKQFWETELRKPVFFTPGDNDWTDCDRTNLPTPVSELERLEAVRKILFSEPLPLGPEWQYERQGELPENAMWWHAGVLFVTVHIVGTGNGRTEILRDPQDRALALVEARDRANRQWLERAFDLARSNDIAALVIAMQVDMFGHNASGTTAFERCRKQPAFAAYCEQLRQRGVTLRKPVLLLHGDTNAYCLDQPFPGAGARLMWRLNAPGDFKYIDAVLVSVDVANPQRPFAAQGLFSQQAVPEKCDYSR
jgi:hypothetical protein